MTPSRHGYSCFGRKCRQLRWREKFELCKDVCEVCRIAVEAQHVAAAALHDTHTALPELVTFGRQLSLCDRAVRRRTSWTTATNARRDEEWLQWVADLVAHVRVWEIEAGQYERVQFAVGTGVIQWIELGVEFGADKQVDEDDVGWINECNVLPALQKQRPVDAA